MTEEHKELCKEFTDYERFRGIKALKRIAPHLKPLFSYLQNETLKAEEMSFKQAQEFQTYLSTLEDKDGSLHYATLTVVSLISMAKRLYDYLRHEGKVYTNPFLGIKRIKPPKRLPRNIPHEHKMNEYLDYLSKFWEHKEVRARRIYYKIHVIAELQYATGLRISEVMDLESADIDFEQGLIKVRHGKGGKERIAYVNEYALKVLKIYITEMREVINVNKQSKKLFAVHDVTGIVQTVNKYLNKAAFSCGMGEFTSHSFRHSLGFHLLRRGCDMRYIQLILGHEDMNTTTIYTKVEKGDLKKELDRYHPRQFKKYEKAV